MKTVKQQSQVAKTIKFKIAKMIELKNCLLCKNLSTGTQVSLFHVDKSKKCRKQLDISQEENFQGK